MQENGFEERMRALKQRVPRGSSVAPSDAIVRPVVMMTTSFVAVETGGGTQRKTGDEDGIAASQAATRPPRDAEKISSKLVAVRALQPTGAGTQAPGTAA